MAPMEKLMTANQSKMNGSIPMQLTQPERIGARIIYYGLDQKTFHKMGKD